MQTVRFNPKITELIQLFLRSQNIDPNIYEPIIKFSQQLDSVILPKMMSSKYLIKHGHRESKLLYQSGFSITHADIVLYKTDYYVVIGTQGTNIKIRSLVDPNCIKIKSSCHLTFIQQDPIYISVSWATAICLYINPNLDPRTIGQMFRRQMSVIYPLLLDVGQWTYNHGTVLKLNELKRFLTEKIFNEEIEKNII